MILRCNSSGDLYLFTSPSPSPVASFTAGVFSPSTSHLLSHQRLDHPGDLALSTLVARSLISFDKQSSRIFCNGCQLGTHSCLPFSLLALCRLSIFNLFILMYGRHILLVFLDSNFT